MLVERARQVYRNQLGIQEHSGEPSARAKNSSQRSMGWIEEYRRRTGEPNAQTHMDPDSRFREAARQRWLLLGEELKADVAEFNSRKEGAEFSSLSQDRYVVRNPSTGLELDIAADFDSRVVRYSFSALNDQSAGVPEGGILSMRQSRRGSVEFYSADERLTSEEARQVLLEPVLFPPQLAA